MGSFRPCMVLLACLLLVVFFAEVPLAEGVLGGDELVSLARTAGKPVIADFGLGFCMQCKKQAATLKEVGEVFSGRVVVRMVNVSKEQALTERYKVELIPTLVFLDGKGKVVYQKVGPLGFEEIRRQLSRMGVK